MNTVKEVKNYLRANWEKGVDCPCCGQGVKQWKKTIISTAAASLCKLVSMYDGKAIHLDEFNVLPKDRNFNQLVLWKLVRPEDKKTDDDKRASGMWHPTELGKVFARGLTTVPRYVYTYNNKLVSTSDNDETISIKDALRNKFSWEELIKQN